MKSSKKTYRVYCLKNRDDVPVYVGYTSRSLHNRWRHHKDVHPDRAKLVIELIVETDNKEQAKSLEVLFQKQYDTIFPDGLNVAVGHRNSDGKLLAESGKKTRFGIRNKYPGEENKRKQLAKEAMQRKGKPILCITTGVIYPSINACARQLDINPGSLHAVLTGKSRYTKGLRFEFLVPNKNSL